MSYVKRALNVTVQLNTGAFTADGSNKVTISGLRVVANIRGVGSGTLPELHARIYGLPLSQINQLTRIGPINAVNPFNQIAIASVDAVTGAQTTVYSGNIQQAWPDFADAPNGDLNILAKAGIAAAITPVKPVSYNGPVDAVVAMQGFAGTANFAFENGFGGSSGIVLNNPYFPGTVMDQIRACAEAARINFTVDGAPSPGYQGTLAIWAKNGNRAAQGQLPIVSPATGMRGYPIFSSQGIIVETEFNPNLRQGGQISVQNSILTPANGTWTISALEHDLESERPGGAWFSQMTCFNLQANA